MPKARKVVKNGNAIHKFNVRRKLRIGTRKTGVSAFSMATQALKDVLDNVNQKRYHSNARAALATRGVTV